MLHNFIRAETYAFKQLQRANVVTKSERICACVFFFLQIICDKYVTANATYRQAIWLLLLLRHSLILIMRFMFSCYFVAMCVNYVVIVADAGAFNHVVDDVLNISTCFLYADCAPIVIIVAV